MNPTKTTIPIREVKKLIKKWVEQEQQYLSNTFYSAAGAVHRCRKDLQQLLNNK